MRRAWFASCLGALILSGVSFITVLVLLVHMAPSMPKRAEVPRPPGVFEIPDETPRSTLFHRASAISLAASAKVSASSRQDQLRQRMDRLCLDGRQYNLVVDQSQGVTVVRAGDEVLATVLPEDLPEYASSLTPAARHQLEAVLADNWREHLQTELDEDYFMRQPTFRRFALIFSGWTFLLALAFQALARYFSARILKSPGWSLKTLIWVCWLYLVLSLFPELSDLSNLVSVGMLSPLWELVMVGIGSGLTLTVGTILIRRYLDGIRNHASGLRFETRLATVEAAALFGLRLVVGIGATGVFLARIGVDLGSAAAGAGVFGAVFGWVAQDTIRDLIAGLIIVAEDQFGVGDSIQSPVASGRVESFNLRSTRLRDSDGGVYTVPNNDLRRMKNLSNQFSQVDFQLQISHAGDLERALESLQEEAAQLAREWDGKVLEEPCLLGVQKLTPEGVTLRLQLKTLPLEQGPVERELNRRVKLRFDREGLELAQRWPRALTAPAGPSSAASS